MKYRASPSGVHFFDRITNVTAKFYPAPVSVGALEGQLVHEVIENWEKAVRRGVEPGSVRHNIKVALRASLASLKDNPRVDVGRLGSSISLDSCVAKVYNLIYELEPTSVKQKSQRSGNGTGNCEVPLGAEEYWLTVEDPAIKGQLDRIRDGVVSDFKTGAQVATHSDQLLFYAILWWLKYQKIPERLEIRYPGTVVVVPVPSSDELDVAAEALRIEIQGIDVQFETGAVPACPTTANCRYCPVRQLCDEFWESSETTELRLQGEPAIAYDQALTYFGDVQLIKLPTSHRPDGAVVGAAVASGIGLIRVRIDAHLSPHTCDAPMGARILGAKVCIEEGNSVITTTTGTEVFWEY